MRIAIIKQFGMRIYVFRHKIHLLNTAIAIHKKIIQKKLLFRNSNAVWLATSIRNKNHR